MSQFHIRPERPADYDTIDDIVAAAFKRKTVTDLVRAIRASENYIPELALVAEQDGKIVGHTMLSHINLKDKDAFHEVINLSPLAVAPEYQKQGIGSALVKRALELAETRKEPLVILEGSPGYYPRFGFKYSVPFGIHINLPTWAPKEAAMIYPLPNYSPQIKGQLVYPPAFDVDTH